MEEHQRGLDAGAERVLEPGAVLHRALKTALEGRFHSRQGDDEARRLMRESETMRHDEAPAQRETRRDPRIHPHRDIVSGRKYVDTQSRNELELAGGVQHQVAV